MYQLGVRDALNRDVRWMIESNDKMEPSACKILTSRELQKSELNEAFTKLVNMNKLIEGKYGQVKISPNLHLCLHICECALDYGPLSSFWCFSFERMNGIIGT